MNLTIDRDTLAGLLRTAAPAVPSRTTAPVLRCVKVTTSDGSVSVSATNTELFVTGRATAETGKPGSLCVPADVIQSAVKLAPSGPVSIVSGARAELKYAGGSYKLNTEDVSKFPEWVPPELQGVSFEIDAPALVRCLTRVAFCCSERVESFTTSGVWLEVANGEFNAVATDSIRLGIATAKVADGVQASALVPAPTVQAVKAAFSGRTGPVTVTVWGSTVRFADDSLSIASPLLTGKFAPWRMLEQKVKPHGTTFVDDPSALLRAVRRATVTADAADTAVVLTGEGPTLTLKAAGAVGEGEVEHVCKSQSGVASAVTTKMDPKNLTDALALAASDGVESITFAFEARKAAWVECDGWKYASMPIVK
ncbi:DNA polymerase III subunit beta [Gemmata obscuriglobus]|uniref:Beta sliding clamp n=1 Tax=Gemmata obscuriglobus TaxID=114 RepID=A0A2Z3GY86_9BACT|nr:DNA polymerase III subunit beta [Gemmata obscuriglobus]AWM38723.1 hypothetical protein C1280_18155 [Gemmata obscuriglobus]QEG28308.1 DNA polymerase III subunit beta [Gemmata obscuriglobus]VTS06151.1 dna polymerase iii subunit beta : DNA polymerase III subunit beta OS=Thermoanaerobacterium thermosaccharolyticum M0795 GN=Thethe_02847 PE=4 SV=1: DNA_pol3_beta: DNA_pol3_beta_2 [Gemmata obscuriglobus UQM 2246]